MVVLIKLYIQEGFRVAEVHFCDGNERVLGGFGPRIFDWILKRKSSSECKDMENLQGVMEKDGGEDFGFKNYEKKKNQQLWHALHGKWG